MKRAFAFLETFAFAVACAVLLTMLGALMLPVQARAAEPPEIYLEPQNLTWPEGSQARYSVGAFGDDLEYHWFVVFQGVTYDIYDMARDGYQPWLDCTEMGYGTDETSSMLSFLGVKQGLYGTQVYCEVSNAAGSVQTRPATVLVGGMDEPPSIFVPSYVEAQKGEVSELYCNAYDDAGGTLEYLWMETPTGNFEDAFAVDDGTQVSETFVVDASRAGIRYYICMVTSSTGGVGYSSVIPVEVVGGADVANNEDELLHELIGRIQSAFRVCFPHCFM